MKWRKRLGLIALLGVIVLSVIFGFLPSAVPVDVLPVTRGPFQLIVEQEGKTRVMDRFIISAPVTGYARRLALEVGDSVVQGQVLVNLEPLPSEVLDLRSRAAARARVASAEASLRAAEQQVQAAQAATGFAVGELQRIQRLYEGEHAAKKDLDLAIAEERRAAANQRSAEFAVEVSRHELEAARTTLRFAGTRGSEKSKVVITSPLRGQILRIFRESEGVAPAGQALLEIGNPRALEVEIDVLSSDAVRITPGTPVLFDRWGGPTPLEGRVRTVEPVGFTKISALGVEEQRVLVIADISSPAAQWERLGDGYRVEARFILWEAEDVLQIPTSALFRVEQGWAVFVVRDERAERRMVEPGHRSGLVTEIRAGLDNGELVITHPDDRIDEDIRVQLR